MDRRRILILAIIGAAILSSLCLSLPHTAADIYSAIMLPLVLFIGFILALQIALTYQKDLKMSFLFLALFLIIYTPVNIRPVEEMIFSYGENIIFLVPSLQIINWAMLIASCIFTLRVIEAKRMNKYGWIVFGLFFILCFYIIIYDIPDMLNSMSISPTKAVTGMVIRVFDMAIVLMLVPVLLLYLQYSKSNAQESLTFMLIMIGIIISLLSTYIILFVLGSLDESVLNAIYLFGYMIIAIGLYAHRKNHEWGFQMIEKALG